MLAESQALLAMLAGSQALLGLVVVPVHLEQRWRSQTVAGEYAGRVRLRIAGELAPLPM